MQKVLQWIGYEEGWKWCCATQRFAVFLCDFDANLSTSSERANDAFYMCITWKHDVFQWKKVLYKLNTFFEKNGVICCISMRFWCQFINIIGTREWCVLHVYYMKIPCISVKKSVVQIEHFSKKTALFAVFLCDFDANLSTSSERANDGF